MDEDPRFPNRKKKRDWDDMSALDKPVNAGEPTEEAELPVNVYRVVPPAQKTKAEELAEQAELYAHRAKLEAAPQPPVTEAPYVPDPVYHAPEPAQTQTTPEQGKKEGVGKFFESQARLFAAIGVGFVFLIGLAIVAAFWTARSPEGRYDLGSVTNSAAGLKGHLFVEWDKQLNYRLSIEPDDPARQTAFAAAVANSPRPLSVEIHLQDSQGFVLCSREILLKYDARNAVQLAPPAPDPQAAKPDAQAAKTNAAAPPAGQPAPAVDFTQADAQEAAREKGKEIFKTQVGPDGKVTGISAQGEVPCTAKAYEKAVAWSFTPNFPTTSEQDAMIEHQQETGSPEHPPAETPVVRKKAVAKPPQKVVTFAIEGDDSIVDFDTSRGIIETTSGKAFFVDKASGAISDPRWQDYPVEIHYRCDQTAMCVLMHRGSGVLHVRLRR